MKLKKIRLSHLVLDPDLQPRAGLDEKTINGLIAFFEDGGEIEGTPPHVFDIDGKPHLVDGWHRVTAAKCITGLTHLPFMVHEGTRREALLFSLKANVYHGRNLSRAEKRKAVETLLRDPEWSQWSDREIARQTGVSHKTVGKVRAKLSGETPQMGTSRKVRRGGSEYTVDTTNIGGPAPTNSDWYCPDCDGYVMIDPDGRAVPHDRDDEGHPCSGSGRPAHRPPASIARMSEAEALARVERVTCPCCEAEVALDADGELVPHLHERVRCPGSAQTPEAAAAAVADLRAMPLPPELPRADDSDEDLEDELDLALDAEPHPDGFARDPLRDPRLGDIVESAAGREIRVLGRMQVPLGAAEAGALLVLALPELGATALASLDHFQHKLAGGRVLRRAATDAHVPLHVQDTDDARALWARVEDCRGWSRDPAPADYPGALPADWSPAPSAQAQPDPGALYPGPILLDMKAAIAALVAIKTGPDGLDKLDEAAKLLQVLADPALDVQDLLDIKYAATTQLEQAREHIAAAGLEASK